MWVLSLQLTDEKDCLIAIGPEESKLCEISFISNPVLMDLEDRPRNIDIIKKRTNNLKSVH